MVDSVIFRVNDLFENRLLVEYLASLPQGKKKMVKQMDEPLDHTREIYLKRYHMDVAKGTSYSEGYSAFVRSSHYDVAFYINYNKNYVEFNISLPKYYFGNNTLQLIDHYFDPDYLVFRNQDFWDCQGFAFKRFRQILNLFLEKELMGKVNKAYVEIMRIDLCYNLIFRDESDARYYLTELKSIKRKKFSDYSEVQTNYLGGFYFPSKDFTVKAYLKGLEFKSTGKGKKVSDYTKVKKRFGQEVAERVLRMAKCMLRYEVEFRRGYLTEMFYSMVKESKPVSYQCLKYSRQFSASGYISVNGVKKNIDGFIGQAESVNGVARMSSVEKEDLKIGDFIRSKDLRFMLRMNPDYSLLSLDKSEVLTSYDHLEEFNYDLFEVLVEKFKSIFMHFQLGNYENLNALNIFLQQKREGNFKQQMANMLGKSLHVDKIGEGKLRWIMTLLLDYSWDQIKEQKLLPPRTFYRYKKFCESVGLKEKNVNYNFAVKYNYQNYYDLVFPDFNYVTQRTMF